MEDNFDKYFTHELNNWEKEEFLSEVAANEDLKEEFIENQQLMALVALLPRKEEEEDIRRRLSEFMLKAGKR